VEQRPFGKITTVFNGRDGFARFEGQRGSDFRSLPTGSRTIQDKALLRDPFFLLQARSQPGFRVAAAGSGKVGESAVDWVQAEAYGQRFTVGLDAASGRVVSLAMTTRGPGGKFGNLQLQFGEFRSESGLNYPYRVEAQFNGQPLPNYSYIVSEIEINQPVERSLFEKPKSNP